MLVRNWIVCIMVFSTRVSREEHPTDEKHHQPYAFVDYVKAKMCILRTISAIIVSNYTRYFA